MLQQQVDKYNYIYIYFSKAGSKEFETKSVSAEASLSRLLVSTSHYLSRAKACEFLNAAHERGTIWNASLGVKNNTFHYLTVTSNVHEKNFVSRASFFEKAPLCCSLHIEHLG